ncbi:MAG: cation-translocating P-type ATPase [Saprospiraceae bacterium]|nr:cation-translocating P-type ATPase [Saprospiraceae bacterium]
MITGKYTGLSSDQVEQQRKKFGSNLIKSKNPPKWLEIIVNILSEPLFLILVATAGIYFLLGEQNEAYIMLAALVFVSGISLFQENRSSKAEKALQSILEPKTKVIRNSNLMLLEIQELVVDDIFMIEDGEIVPADAILLESHDLSINESILTGESVALYKGSDSKDFEIFQGTQVMSGYAVAKVRHVGISTKLGEIQTSLHQIKSEKTPIQIQIRSFVSKMVQFGLFAFLIIWAIQYYITQNFIFGLLKGLTLSMSLLPEEIPVAFSTFMALGTLHLYKKQVLVKNPMTVETLGGVTVICLDKTGTITENKMQLKGLYDLRQDQISDTENLQTSHLTVLEYSMWASEESPFDPMEQSIHQLYEKLNTKDLRKHFRMVKEYPLTGLPPVMVHVFENQEGQQIIACKGGLESVLKLCKLQEEDLSRIMNKYDHFANMGHRVLAVAKGKTYVTDLPDDPYAFEMEMLGLVTFYDPPKQNIAETIHSFYKAGIEVKILSGDYANTTSAIARQIGIKNTDKTITGSEVMAMNEQSLVSVIKSKTIFARMFPEAKCKVIQALKNSGEIVSMTGDGVNDGPALKASHIGIAMGQRGSELARKTASLILAQDDLSRLVDAIALGRRIYENLKKAIQYIISIHIPIILIVTLPVLFFWDINDFFSPIHVIFLELIMGPTCSILFENEPIEPHSMSKPPRKAALDLFTWGELNLSILQGLAITLVCLLLARYYMYINQPEDKVRSMLYTCLVFANIFLTLVNRSFIESVLKTLRYKNKLVPIIIGISLIALMLSLSVPSIREIFQFDVLNYKELLLCLCLGLLSVIWVEVYKWFQRKSLVVL